MRIMFVGDSMTVGRTGDFTWRYRMWQHLSAVHEGPYRIVGPRSALHDALQDSPTSYEYGDPGFPEAARRHLAGWGEGWLHMAPLIGDAVRGHAADTLLVSLGLIDLGFYTNAGQTAENVRRFVAEARAAVPRVRAVLMPVIPNVRALTDAPFGAECERFNGLLAEAVADLSTPESPLLLAAAPDGWDIDHATYDGTHPSPAGEHLLAGAFAEAMHQGWGVGAPYARTRTRPRNRTRARDEVSVG
ncbi:GDSL-type esterase/lipase family protein [Streptomyces celluloflavus]|uniref:GDSL-type esterase/lipase family protein n=1 Tax=Streptomyces celluloflavus TaxID=58344 RepID=A0ABW7RC15_9ACTN